MSPRWRKVLRDAWLHKPRTLLVVAAIAVGIVGAGAVLDTWALVRAATRDEFRASNPASATLRTDSIDAALLARVRERPDVRFAQARRQTIASMRVADGPRTAMLFVVDDFQSIRVGKVQPERGTWPPMDDGFVLETSSVEFSGLAVGDSVIVQIGDGPPCRLAVSGTARDVGLAPGWMEHVVYGFVTRGTLARLGAPATLNELQIVVRDDAMDRDAIRRVAYDVKGMLEGAGHAVSDVDVPVPGQHIHAAQMDSLLFTQGAFGLLALLLSGFLVVNLVAAMLAGQVREIGVMKAIGATSTQIGALYLVLALVLGVVASAIAIPAAAIIGRSYATFTAGMLNFDVSAIAIPRRAFALQLIVAILVPVLAASIPVARWCGITVSEALRDFGISARAGSSGGRVLARAAGLTRPLLLSLRNAFRRRQRMVLTLLPLATGGAVYLGALNLRASVIGSVDLLFASQRFDLTLRFARAWQPESLEAAVGRVAGVSRAEAWGATRGAVSRADGTMGNTFVISAPPADTRLLVPRLKKGRWLQPGDDRAIVVNTRLVSDDRSLVLGKEVTLVIAGQRKEWTVVGVVETGPSPNAFVSRTTLAAQMKDARVDRAVVADSAGTPASRLALVQQLRSELGSRGFDVQSSQLVQAGRVVMEDHLLMVAGFLGIMARLMILVGGLGLASTMSLAVLERTREIGVLRAIGARHGAILTMVHIEALVIALASWVIAIPLSVPMSVVLGKAFGRIMIPVPVTFTPEIAGVVRWLIVVVVVSIVASAWPAYRATRIPTARALAYE
jgi:putative ABC transport system permease protein